MRLNDLIVIHSFFLFPYNLFKMMMSKLHLPVKQ